MTSKPTTIRLPAETIEAVNSWRAAEGYRYGDPSFSKAVVILVRMALEVRGVRGFEGDHAPGHCEYCELPLPRGDVSPVCSRCHEENAGLD